MQKKSFVFKKGLLLTFGAMFAANVFAAASVNDRVDTSSSFYENSEDGWFWYKDEKEESLRPEEKKLPPEEQLKNAEDTEKAFSVAWLRKNIPRYRDLAIDNPTPENVKAFLLVQRVMLDKAENFATAVQTQVVGDALVDESARRGLSTVAANSLNAKGIEESRKLLASLSDKVGIFFFFSSTCPYCKAQEPILGYFTNRYDIAVMGVSVDGNSLNPNGNEPFPWKPDAGLAQQLGLTHFPALVLVTPQGDAEPISQGILSLNEIEQRILLVAKRKGWIKEEEFEKTRPLVEGMRNDLSKALNADTPLAQKKLQSYQQDDGFIPPDRLVPLVTMRAKLTNTDMSTAKSLVPAKEVETNLKKAAEK